MTDRTPIHSVVRSVVARLGHLAVWLGFYVAGACVLLHMLLSRSAGTLPSPDALAGAFCTGMGVYLFDRVKLSDALLDPSDAAAHPARFQFISSRSRLLRVVSLSLGIVATLLVARLSPLAIALVPLAYLGVWLYAGVRVLPARRARKRVKDVLVLKNAVVGVSIAAFALVLVIADDSRASGRSLLDAFTPRTVDLALALAFVSSHVFVDAVLCDVDDRSADARFGTDTIPARAGVDAAWWTAMIGNVVLLLAAVGLSWTLDTAQASWFSLAMLATLVGLRLWRPTRVRDLVDLRLPACALAVAMLTSG